MLNLFLELLGLIITFLSAWGHALDIRLVGRYNIFMRNFDQATIDRGFSGLLETVEDDALREAILDVEQEV